MSTDRMTALEQTAAAIVSREYAVCTVLPDPDHDGADGLRCLTARVNGSAYGAAYAPVPGYRPAQLAEWIIEVVEDAANG